MVIYYLINVVKELQIEIKSLSMKCNCNNNTNDTNNTDINSIQTFDKKIKNDIVLLLEYVKNIFI